METRLLRYESLAEDLGGIIVAVLTLAFALRHLARRPARELLNEGAVEAPEGILGNQPARWRRFIPAAAVVAAIALGFAGTRLPAHQQPATFFGVGALILTAGILALRRRFLAPVPRTDGLSRSAFTWRAPSRQPTRSAATVRLSSICGVNSSATLCGFSRARPARVPRPSRRSSQRFMSAALACIAAAGAMAAKTRPPTPWAAARMTARRTGAGALDARRFMVAFRRR